MIHKGDPAENFAPHVEVWSKVAVRYEIITATAALEARVKELEAQLQTKLDEIGIAGAKLMAFAGQLKATREALEPFAKAGAFVGELSDDVAIAIEQTAEAWQNIHETIKQIDYRRAKEVYEDKD